ncbi:hypothetical protein ABAZ39_16570 (plasmid) [Azospirillum argentinense]|uniref:Uncharacterized protein n=1 Tax=Azospirillum argentinense TaxID=2970906 RepID=A0A060DHB3_9PROT|nr:hypothetical protein [Azospirillum argentinense]AIB13556.1 hypothetical protein ABAZ39_16570 [Azospirillum argentinense]EZQ06545.1 hypothetical protein ABAZ39_21555 [Azospirillum argentinense]
MTAITPKPTAAPETAISERPPADIPRWLARRRDMPEILSGRTAGGDSELNVHFRAEPVPGGLRLVDVSEEIAAKLQAAAAEKLKAEQAAQVQQVARVGATGPTHHRGQHGELRQEHADRAGEKRHRVVSALVSLFEGRHLTPLHLDAGKKLATDAEALSGGKPAPGYADPAVDCSTGGGRAWEDFLIEAGTRFRKARAAVTALPAFEEIELWPLVDAVVVQGRYLTDVAGSKAKSVLNRYRTALRIGLEEVGACYGLPVRHEFIVESVIVCGATAEVQIIQEPDETWRARALNWRPWVAVARDRKAMFAKARDELLDVVARETGFTSGRKSLVQVEKALRDDRLRGIAQAQAERKAAADKIESDLKNMEQEKNKVLRRKVATTPLE